MPTTADCRASSSAERAPASFRATRRPLFTCGLTVSGEHASYLMEVLRSGCFVAEVAARAGRSMAAAPTGRSLHEKGVSPSALRAQWTDPAD